MTATAAPSEPIGPRRLRRRILLLAVMPLLAAVAVIALAVRSQAQDLALQERALVETAYLASKEAELTVKFGAELISSAKDAAGNVVEGDPRAPRKQRDVWTFARTMGSADPNWQLVATGG